MAISKDFERVTLEVLNGEAFSSGLLKKIYFQTHDLSSLAEWLERPTAILEGHGFDYHWGTQKFFFSFLGQTFVRKNGSTSEDIATEK